MRYSKKYLHSLALENHDLEGNLEKLLRLLEMLDSLSYYEIRSELKPVLSRDDPFNLPEAQKEVEHFLRQIQLNEKERAFLAGSIRREYRFSLLSSDPDFSKKMSRHPLFLWKAAKNNR